MATLRREQLQLFPESKGSTHWLHISALEMVPEGLRPQDKPDLPRSLQALRLVRPACLQSPR